MASRTMSDTCGHSWRVTCRPLRASRNSTITPPALTDRAIAWRPCGPHATRQSTHSGPDGPGYCLAALRASRNSTINPFPALTDRAIAWRPCGPHATRQSTPVLRFLVGYSAVRIFASLVAILATDWTPWRCPHGLATVTTIRHLSILSSFVIRHSSLTRHAAQSRTVIQPSVCQWDTERARQCVMVTRSRESRRRNLRRGEPQSINVEYAGT